jgi:hypothetical protein
VTEIEPRVVSLTVDRVDDDGSSERGGVLRHKTYAFIPELGMVKYPTVLWVTGDRPAKGTTLNALLHQGALRNGKNGTYPSDYFYDVVEWDVADGPSDRPVRSPSQEIGTPRTDTATQPRPDPVRASIEAQVAMKAAVEFFAKDVDASLERVTNAAHVFYDCIQSLQHPLQSTESPVEAPESPEPRKAPGKAIKVPNQVTVEETMNSLDFVKASKECGWDGDTVATYLGTSSLTEWAERNGTGDNYRAAWDFCINAWETQQVENLPW